MQPPHAEQPFRGTHELEAAEYHRRVGTQYRALTVALSATLLMAVVALGAGQPEYLWASAIGSAGFLAALVCVWRGSLAASQLMVILTTVALVTEASIRGGGIHDPSVLAYPVILIWAGLSLSRRWFLVSVAAVAVSASLVVMRNQIGFPTAQQAAMPSAHDLLTTAVILFATTYAVWLLARTASNNLETAYREIERRAEIEGELQHLSSRDPLTGIYNRRFFDAELDRMEKGRQQPVSVLVADIDGLKQVNDRYGHEFGDKLVIDAAEFLSSMVRAEDVLARIGGDEFSLLMPDTGEDAAARTAARIAEGLSERPGRDGVRLSLSLGTATSTDGELRIALRHADARMYEQKGERTGAQRD